MKDSPRDGFEPPGIKARTAIFSAKCGAVKGKVFVLLE